MAPLVQKQTQPLEPKLAQWLILEFVLFGPKTVQSALARESQRVINCE